MGDQQKKDAQSTHTLSDAIKQARPDEVDQAIEMLRRHWQSPLKEELAEREKLLDQKQQDLTEVGEANKRLLTGIEDVRGENENLRRDIAGLREVKGSLVKDLNSSNERLTTLEGKMEEMARVLEKATNTNTMLSEKLDEAEKERDRFAQDVADTAEKVTMQETAIQELTERVEAANKVAAEEVEKVTGLEAKLSRYRDAVGKATSALSTIEFDEDEPAPANNSERPKTRSAPFETNVPKKENPPADEAKAKVASNPSFNPASATPTQPIPTLPQGKLQASDWAQLKVRLDQEIARYRAMPKQAMSTGKLTGTLVPLLKRYEGGERTMELATEIAANCR